MAKAREIEGFAEAGSFAEAAHPHRDEHGRAEEPDPRVDTQRRSAERARERDVAERVAGEDLGAEHEEVPDQAAGDGDEAPRQERVAHELVAQHQPAAARQTRAPT